MEASGSIERYIGINSSETYRLPLSLITANGFRDQLLHMIFSRVCVYDQGGIQCLADPF